jgi:ArsR family transcriptional regulator, lead/cadmium/zinc/bismuth-responsive transcriptional repressor
MFSVLGDPSRFHIFRVLLDEEELCVSELASALDISVPAASQQLRIVERAGLIRRNRMGQKICYEIRKEDSLVKSIIKLFE